MDVRQRRDLLDTRANPDGRIDYVTTLDDRIAPDGPFGEMHVRVRYVPDRLILTPEGFRAYLDGVSALAWDSVEALAVTLLGDVNDEIVPRWLEVAVETRSGDNAHSVMLEDRQPNWDNASILSRLEHH